jgi:hypothetical protein
MAGKNSDTNSLFRAALDILGSGTGVGALLARGLGGNNMGPSSVGADGTPAETYPNPLHTVDVAYQPGEPKFNSMLQRGVADKAAQMQTLKEHNDTLLKYLRQLPPNASDKAKHLAIMQGFADEQALDSYWDDKKPRKDYTPNSSAVRSVRVTPDNRIEVQWGTSPKWYTFRQYPDPYKASLAMKQLLTSDSIGRAVMPYLRNGKPVKFKTPGVAWWNKKNYDGAMA